MDIFEQNTSSYQENKSFLSHSYASKAEFVSKYTELYYGKMKAKELYLQILIELESTISLGSIDKFKKLNSLISHISIIESQSTLRTYYDNTNNPIQHTNLIILACKHNKDEILMYIFNNDEILSNLSIIIGKDAIKPEDEDETCHNACYYAIRSCNVQLFDTLINKWSENYFSANSTQLDEILSIAYEELKLRNVPLSNEIEIVVETKLINLRFYFNDSEQVQNVKTSLSNINQRIELVLENISLLNLYAEVDERFLCTAKFVAHNINILKRHLKSTYARLPWEEIEFCLISFVFSHVKQQEINVFYRITLNKDKILKHLKNFAKKLEEEKEKINHSKQTNFPKLKREEIIAQIVDNNPEFEELYNDYQFIKDIHSLKKINNYIKLALSTDPKEKEGQLIITRTLQVTGENLKNTLESPKLSNTTSELLLLSLPRNTRKVIIDLRNSLSHAKSLFKRIEIQENVRIDFFTGIQNDIKKINAVINVILNKYKIITVKNLLQKVVSSENFDEIKEIAEIFNNVEFNIDCVDFTLMEHGKLRNLIKELMNCVSNKTSHEEQLFSKIEDKINKDSHENTNFTKFTTDNTDYIIGFSTLKDLNFLLCGIKIDNNIIRGIKYRANKSLEIMTSKIKPISLKEIAELASQIFRSVSNRSGIQPDSLDEIRRIIYEICHIAKFESGNIKWIENLSEKLNEKGSVISEHKQNSPYNVTEGKYNSQLILKLTELKRILGNNALSNQLTDKFISYKSDKKLQTVVEMLVLDIMSILDSSKGYLTDNSLFLDDNTPLLIGKCLRNHLAHDNVLVDIFLSDPCLAIILNAKKLIITKNITVKNKTKIGKRLRDEPFKLKNKHDRDIDTIIKQKNMFASLEAGNLEDFKNCMKNGADIHARSINLWTTLHFAAKGPSIEVIKFILDQNFNVNVKDINGQSPLHIAATYGRSNIVKLFIEKVGLCINETDYNGETPLHIASQNGHINTIQVLLKNKANIVIKNRGGLSPLHCAIRNHHIDAVKVLLEKDANVDINEIMGGYTPLHEAAERGNLELVNFLLEHNANVNAKSDRNWTPLHAAALNGYLEVVNTLISKGAEVNASVLDGCTPLHYAVENGHKKIVDVLLKHGVNINVADKTYKHTPLHYAAKDGYEEIVKTLLENKANANATTVDGVFPLHLATQYGHLEIVIALLKHSSANISDNQNGTPLHVAAANGHKKIADILIKNKAEINVKDNDHKFTPLHVAAVQVHKDIIDLLIKNKAEINIRDNKGRTPLHVATSMDGSKSIIDVLIKNKAEVNGRTNNGFTPLHLAALHGRIDAIVVLIKNKAEVNAKDNCGSTPLCSSVIAGHKDAVQLLIKNNAQVNTTIITGDTIATPLRLAVEIGNKEVTEILIANGANINAKSKRDSTLLISAIKHNYKEIVEVLIANGANVNTESGKPLLLAVFSGYKDIVEILLQNKAHVNNKYGENLTILHVAAKNGDKGIVKALIAKGANVNAISTDHNSTPLFIAAAEGHEEVVEVLILNGANIDTINTDNFESPLHIAAGKGHKNIVAILLHNGADISIKDYKNRTCVELAVAHGHLQVVKTLLQHEKVDVNAKSNDDWTMLHIAAQEGNLEITKCLVDNGANINAKNSSGSKPIHIAARDGFKHIVEFFLSKGLNINDSGIAKQTLLHYTAIRGKSDVAEYLIEQGIDVNMKDANGKTPMHIAAFCGSKEIIKVLLKNSAIYNSTDNFNIKPLEMAHDKDIINLLTLVEKLFEAVKQNSSSEVLKYIKAKAFVNAKNVNSGTPLLYASWKGFDKVVGILLQNKGNPNVSGIKGFTPLHYATKFSHFKVVKALLFNGAIYNPVSDTGKTPLNLAVDKSIVSLLQLVDESFKNIKNGNSKAIHDLQKITDFEIIKAVMNARSRENKTLVVTAIHNDFPKVKQLKYILQDDLPAHMLMVHVLNKQEKYQESLNILRKVLYKRQDILGSDNPGTLDIETSIAKVLYKQQRYQEALNMFEEIYQKQKEILGMNNQDALCTKSFIALVLHRLGKNEEALNIYKEVHQKQKEILGISHSDVVETQLHMALVLDHLNKHEEALRVNYEVFENYEKTYGINDPRTLSVQNNIAIVLNNHGKHDEAIKMYQTVHETRRRILGPCHSDTLRPLYNMVEVLLKQEKYTEALKTCQEVFNTQKAILGPSHLDTLSTQYNMANILFSQGKHISALKNYVESLEQRKAILGPNHPEISATQLKIDMINIRYKLDGSGVSEILQHLQKEINIAANNGDIQTIQRLLQEGADPNDKDVDGRTPIHFAIDNGQINIINILLKNGADVTQVTNKGNTPLHTATSKGYKEIIEILLKHVNHSRLNDFINAQTTVGGTTSLHVAAKNGFLEIVKLLLTHGAIYNIVNKEHQTPLDLSKDRETNNLLKLIEELYDDAEYGNIEIIDKLRLVQPDELIALTNTRNNQRRTLLQVVLTKQHEYIASELLKMFKI